MANVGVQIKGLDDLVETLGGMERKLQNKVVRFALRRAATPVRDDAKSFVPIATGALHDSIRMKERKFGGRHIKAVEVTAGDYEAWYAHIVENGSSKWSGDPFLRPAMDINESKVPDIFLQAAKMKLAEVVK